MIDRPSPYADIDSEAIRRRWSTVEIVQLRELLLSNTPTRLIAEKLGRSPSAIQSKASSEGLRAPRGEVAGGGEATARVDYRY